MIQNHMEKLVEELEFKLSQHSLNVAQQEAEIGDNKLRGESFA